MASALALLGPQGFFEAWKLLSCSWGAWAGGRPSPALAGRARWEAGACPKQSFFQLRALGLGGGEAVVTTLLW